MISIIPKPNSLVQKEGYFELKNCKAKNEFAEVDWFVNELLDELNLQGDENGEVNIYLTNKSKLEKEEYELVISEKGVEVFASNGNGAFYGLQTLKQILLQNSVGQAGLTVPYVEIKDKPRFEYRSFMLDEARHFFGKDIVKEMLDIMALLKLNRFHWHLTDDQGWRVEIKKYPLLTEKGTTRKSTQISWQGVITKTPKNDDKEYGKGCFYTQDELKELVEYAKKRYIEVCPEVDMPGHLYAAIACYPELSCFDEKVEVSNKWGIRKTIGCAGRHELYDFVHDVIDELSEIFPAGYFHIGGDEAPKDKWKECPKCQQKMMEQGLKDEQELQAYFNNQIAEYLEKYGKRTVAWNEILKGEGVSDRTIVQLWLGNPNLNGVNKWLEKGNNVIISSKNNLYMDYPYGFETLKKSYQTDLELVGIDKKYEKQILGFEAPLWSEWVATKDKLEFQVFPRMMSLAEINWTYAENKDYEEFEARLRYIFEYMDKKNISYASKEAFAPSGLSGLIRLVFAGQDMVLKPQKEYETYKRIR